MKKFRAGIAAFLAVIFVALGGFGGYYGYQNLNPIEGEAYSAGELQVHFLELGNWYTGDCTYVKAGETDILIDAGSNTSSISTIKAYLDKYVTDGILEYVIVTHAHKDHYAGFATNENTNSLFDIYDCKTIIDFAQTNQKEDAAMYSNYIRERDAEIAAGAKHYTAKECVDSGNTVFELASGVTMTVLDQKYYHEKASSGENDHSVCTLFTSGDKNVLLTGDLEEKGEKSLIEKNALPEIDVYKAGHHGSGTSSCPEFLQVISPEIVCVCCCAGSDEYTVNKDNQFPYQKFINNVAPYTDAVYVTTVSTNNEGKTYDSLNGNITVIISKGEIELQFSASDKKLKDSAWFKDNRKKPSGW